MKNLVLLLALVSIGAVAHGHGDPAHPRLCPKYTCSAQADDSDYHRPHVGFGKGNSIQEATEDAVRNCKSVTMGGDCTSIQCSKFTGPVIPLIPCKSQWSP